MRPISIWVDIAPKREKIAEKWQFNFKHHHFWHFHIAFPGCYCIFVQCTPHLLRSPALHILALHHPTRNSADATTDNTPATAPMKNRQASRAHSAYAWVYARAFQQRCCFFAVTSVTLDCFLTPFFEDFPNHIHPKSHTPLNDFLRNKDSQTVKENNKTAITLSFTKQ